MTALIRSVYYAALTGLNLVTVTQNIEKTITNGMSFLSLPAPAFLWLIFIFSLFVFTLSMAIANAVAFVTRTTS